MTLRHSLLAVLTLGPAYGYQLHGEVVERTRRDTPLNVGQVYSTLDRLRRDELIASAGITDDHLPLYELTDDGIIEARMHLTEPDIADWHDMVERILLALSLPGSHHDTLVANYRRLWEPYAGASSETLDPTGGQAQAAAEHAARLLRSAALAWLDSLPDIEPWPLRTDRRRRGRRAAESAHPPA
ncbi:MAG: PadR family transcriptional regulator [Actinobacteria bacterium]|nr:PadR family transcriptional regulator [Actinomycetota bacterium]MBU1609506.1 PadR family transcriptional regulator [Actinomycetota bacterium]MBU2315341.1 PadR family transcriptional regulator [Actinomycetota bacterium]MBU2385539.1 PadR family transcriptional regulator [Actinomycetota bacterium]